MCRFILLSCLVTFLGGCATGSLYSEVSVSPINKATVCFYRPYRAFKQAGVPNIHISDAQTFS